jgi:pimeloyl-ACP methyl ester carboxylesterase
MHTMKNILTLSAITATLLMSGCSEEKSTTLQDNLKSDTVSKKVAGYTVFNPTTGEIPYPNNILFAPNSSSNNDADGTTLNIGYEDSDADASIKKALNALTGFSIVAPISAPITATLDAATITGESVQVYKVLRDPASGAVVSIDSDLVFGVDYIALQSGSSLVIQPTKPLANSTTYMVVLTSNLKDADGRSLQPDALTALTLSSNEILTSANIDAASAAGLNQVRLGNLAMQAALVVHQKDPSNTVALWNFTTQTVGNVLSSIYEASSSQTMVLVNTETNSTLNAANIYSGTLNVPYYLEVPSETNPIANLTGYFKDSDGKSIVSGVPISTQQTIPVLLSTPKTVMPTTGWPVVIFQHGVTANRTHLYAVADSFAAAGFMVVSIDLPLHGITPESSLASLRCSAPCVERTFDVDFYTEVNEVTTATTPDTITDSSGAHFMNLLSLLTTRDNGRQASSDLMTLFKSLGGAVFLASDLQTPESTKIDTSNVHYVGHSMGSMTAFGFLNNESDLKTVSLFNSGSNWAGLLQGSQKYGTTLKNGLAAVGIIEGSASYNSFLIALQTVLESSDPVSYASSVAAKHTIHLTKVNNDDSVPNNVSSFPFAGTEGLISLMGATTLDTSRITDTIYSVGENDVIVNYSSGVHTSILRPTDEDGTDYTAVTTIMQESMASFVSTNGTALKISNTTNIAQ